MKKLLFLIADRLIKKDNNTLVCIYGIPSVYIAGKITGDPFYRVKFDRARRMLAKHGFQPVINPAELPDGISYECCMKICFAMLDACEATCFLPDWRDSSGAIREFARALFKRKHIAFLTEDDLR